MKEQSKILSKLFSFISNSEENIEITRKILCNQKNFDPYQIFKFLDSNAQSKITSSDLKCFILKHFTEDLNNIDLFTTRLIFNYDSNKKGNLSYGDFMNFCLSERNFLSRNTYFSDLRTSFNLNYDIEYSLLKLIEKEFNYISGVNKLVKEISCDFNDIFKELDINKMKYIDGDTIIIFMQKNGFKVSSKDVSNILKRLDLDKDYKISYLELKSFFQVYSTKTTNINDIYSLYYKSEESKSDIGSKVYNMSLPTFKKLEYNEYNNTDILSKPKYNFYDLNSQINSKLNSKSNTRLNSNNFDNLHENQQNTYFDYRTNNSKMYNDSKSHKTFEVLNREYINNDTETNHNHNDTNYINLNGNNKNNLETKSQTYFQTDVLNTPNNDISELKLLEMKIEEDSRNLCASFTKNESIDTNIKRNLNYNYNKSFDEIIPTIINKFKNISPVKETYKTLYRNEKTININSNNNEDFRNLNNNLIVKTSPSKFYHNDNQFKDNAPMKIFINNNEEEIIDNIKYSNMNKSNENINVHNNIQYSQNKSYNENLNITSNYHKIFDKQDPLQQYKFSCLNNYMQDLIILESNLETIKSEIALKADFNPEKIFNSFEIGKKEYLSETDLKNGLIQLNIYTLIESISRIFKRYSSNCKNLTYEDFFNMISPVGNEFRQSIKRNIIKNIDLTNSTKILLKSLFEELIKTETLLENHRNKIASLAEGDYRYMFELVANRDKVISSSSVLILI